MKKILLNLSNYHTFHPEGWETLLTRYQDREWPLLEAAEVVGVRFGAETCSRLLEKLPPDTVRREIAWLRERSLLSWFVFPVLREEALEPAKKMLEVLAEEPADGIVINDFGLLPLLQAADPDRRMKRILGRCFDKRFRDPRLSLEGEGEGNQLLEDPYPGILAGEGVSCLEWESFGNLSAKGGMEQAVHVPFELVTFGQICELSGLDRPAEGKFSLAPCTAPCLRVNGTGHGDFLVSPVYQFGNALYTQCEPASRLKNKLDGCGWLIVTPWPGEEEPCGF